MDIELRVTVDKMEVDYLIEYLQLVIDNPNIIDEKYPEQEGYKVIGHIDTLIEQLKNAKNKL